MNFKEYILDFSKTELEKINFLDIEVGNTMLELVSQVADLCDSNPEKMKCVMQMLIDIVDQKPLSPITEEDFVEEKIEIQGKEKTIYRCNRCYYVYKDADGKYYNDRAIAFIDNKTGIIFYTGDSKREIEIPYVLSVDYQHTSL